MAAADAVTEEMLKAFDESDATEITLDGDPPAIPVADSPELACADTGSTPSASGVSKPGSGGTWLCTKCKLQKEIGNAVQLAPSFICKQCNTKRSTLSQMFGHWPVDVFVALTVEQQTEFWRSQCKGKVQVQNALVKEVTDARVEETRNRKCGHFLPLSVYAKMGYDIAAIQANCKDVEEHEVLGTTYKVDLKSVATDDIRKKVWADLFKQAGEQKQKDMKKSKKQKKFFRVVVVIV